MIKFAKTHYPASNIAYVEQDIGVEWNDLNPKLKDLEGKVSLIFSNRVLHWVEDKKNAAKNLYRLLSPKGKIYTTVTTLWDLFHDLIPEEKSKIDKILKIPTEEEQIETWRKAFTESGFHNIDIEFFILRQLYPNDEFKNGINRFEIIIRNQNTNNYALFCLILVLLPYFPNLTKKYLIEKDPFKRNKIMTSGLRETVKNAILRHHCRELPNGEDGKPEYELAYGQCRVVATK
jgi:SAM-dependent methyltransferase